MKQNPKYEGVLNEPMNLEDGIDPFLERLTALFDHYGSTNPSEVMLLLAQDHVKGFRFKDRPYNKSSEARKFATRDIIIFCNLVRVDAEKGNVLAAAKMLAEEHPEWGEGSTINQRYQDLKRQNDRGKKNTARMYDLIKLLHSK